MGQIAPSTLKAKLRLIAKIALGLALLLIAVAFIYWLFEVRDLPFDQKVWAQGTWDNYVMRAAHQDESYEGPAHLHASDLYRILKDLSHNMRPSNRERMLENLYQRYNLQGMQSNMVVNLLGPPDLLGTSISAPHLEYFLSRDYLLNEYWYLDIKLDSTGKVSEYKNVLN